MKIAVLLSGCGVYDGSEIHEAVFTLLAIDANGAEYICIAPDKDQYHVVDHITGNEMHEKRNVLTESARIARGEIRSLSDFNINEVDGLAIPGGFGAAKNLNQWALSGPDGDIDADVKALIQKAVEKKIPIAAMCMGPTVVAKALEGSEHHAKLTVGTTEENSPYDIGGITGGMESIGTQATARTIREIEVDTDLKIVSAPCYMMDASITEVYKNIQHAISELLSIIKG